MYPKRIDINKVAPGAYQALGQFDKYLSGTDLPKSFSHLIKIRASLINGCAFCIQSHSKDALADGESQKRIFALNSWKDSPYFSDNERAVLALTDEATLISENGISDEIFDKAVNLLGEQTVAYIILQIASINAWTRIARSTLLMPD